MSKSSGDKKSRKRKASTLDEEAAPGESVEPDFCSICLSNVENKCKAWPCAHVFCYPCLLTWAKIKPCCPLCNQRITTIRFNMKEDGSYKEYKPKKKVLRLEFTPNIIVELDANDPNVVLMREVAASTLAIAFRRSANL